MGNDLRLFPEAASTIAAEVDALYFFLLAVGTFFALLVFGLVFVFSIRFQRRHEAEVPRPIVGSLRLELIWTFIPLILSMVMFAWGAKVFYEMYTPPGDTMNVFVVGKQWMWKLQHSEGHRELNELHVPVGIPVKLIMTSEDVIHSFYVPAFRVKKDVLPGRYTTLWFEATRPGRYHLFCTEYCGTDHSAMIGSVEVMEQADFEDWLNANRPAETLAQAGAHLFRDAGCAGCHSSDSGIRGPDLAEVFGRRVLLDGGGTIEADENYLRSSIMTPAAHLTAGYQPLMPTYEGQLSEEDVVALLAYLRSLSAPGQDSAEERVSR